MSAPLLVLAAGGTGGHMFPAQALAEEMVSIGWRIKLSTDSEVHVTPKFSIGSRGLVIKSATFSGGSFLGKLLVPLIIFYGVLQSLLWFKKTNQTVWWVLVDIRAFLPYWQL